MAIEGGGTVSLPLQTQNGPVKLVLILVAYVPSLRYNILLLSMLTDKAALVGQWGKDRISIKIANGEEVAAARLYAGLYKLLIDKRVLKKRH